MEGRTGMVEREVAEVCYPDYTRYHHTKSLALKPVDLGGPWNGYKDLQNTQTEHKNESGAFASGHLETEQIRNRQRKQRDIGCQANAKRDIIETEQLQARPLNSLRRVPCFMYGVALEDHDEGLFDCFGGNKSHDGPAEPGEFLAGEYFEVEKAEGDFYGAEGPQVCQFCHEVELFFLSVCDH